MKVSQELSNEKLQAPRAAPGQVHFNEKLVPPTEHSEQQGDRVWLRRYSKLVCFATLFLVFMGSLVTSHEAGLSVPDWPRSFGHNLFTYPPSEWMGPQAWGMGAEGRFWEHSHRLVGALVGLLTVVLAFWLAFRDNRLWVSLLGFGAVILVIGQGVLGGLTVLLGLPTWVSVLHAVMAQTFLVLTIILAYTQSEEFRLRRVPSEEPQGRLATRWASITFCLVYVQLVMAAIMRHTQSGLAIPDFPTMAGRWLPVLNEEALAWVNGWRETYGQETGTALPPVTMGQVHIHMTHRFLALLIIMAGAWLTFRTRRFGQGNRCLLRSVYHFDGLVLVQLFLGAWAVLSVRLPLVTSIHVVVGAALLGLATLIMLRTLLKTKPEGAPR